MPGESGGDPHVRTLGGDEFDFKGEPGVRYRWLQAHNIGVEITVADLPGTDAQVIDRAVAFLPNGVSIETVPGFTVIRTPEGELYINQNGGHLSHEGKVFPDPLQGPRKPHLNLGYTERFPLDPNWTSGILVDGHKRPAEDFRVEPPA